MYKNQLQELAQRSCFNLPSYTCVREGPDHAPRFKAVVNFNGENFESAQYCSTLRQAEHSAAEAALASLYSRGVSQSLAARVLDETGVYKNLLQEIAQRVGSPLPYYTTFRSGLSHLPVFTGTVELAGILFRGEPAKNKKQAEKNAALAAWLSLKKLAQQDADSANDHANNDEQEQIRIARALQNYRLKGKLESITLKSLPNMSPSSSVLPKFPTSGPRPISPQRPVMSSKMLPLFYQKASSQNRSSSSSYRSLAETSATNSSRLGVGAAPYAPLNRCVNPSYHGIAPPVTIRTSIPVYSTPPQPAPNSPQIMQCHPSVEGISIRSVVPVFASPSCRRDDQPPSSIPNLVDDSDNDSSDSDVNTVVRCLEQLDI